MKNCNKLVRDNVTEVLRSQGYEQLKGKKLKGDKYKAELYSLFLAEYKETLTKDKPQELQVDYADMLEIIRTLMVVNKTNIKDVNVVQSQPIEWYKSNSPIKPTLSKSRIDLLQKFDELLKLKTEAVKDQLTDVIKSFKQLVETHNISFNNVEKTRRDMYKKLGGYSKGTYLVSVSRTKVHSV